MTPWVCLCETLIICTDGVWRQEVIRVMEKEGLDFMSGNLFDRMSQQKVGALIKY